MSLLAVVDVETTGLFPQWHDRIVEIAAVVMRPDGEILRELSTLINPGRDVGPTRIHGITAGDVHAAPRFNEAAGALLDTLQGCVAVAGHNVRFDLAFLARECERAGIGWPCCPALCTKELAGGSLSDACAHYGVAFDGAAHSALTDARATARLLAKLLRNAPDRIVRMAEWPPIAWPAPPKTEVSLLTREEARRRQEPEPATADLSPEALAGKRVCFTGECRLRVGGVPITREWATELAARHGLTVAEYVTKQLDLLVAADPLTQSVKAVKARQYGIRIVHEPAFWAALGLEIEESS